MANLAQILDALPLPPGLRMHLIAPAMRLTGAWSAAQVGDFGDAVPHARVALRSSLAAIAAMQEEAGDLLEAAGMDGLADMAAAIARRQAGQAIPEGALRAMRSLATFAVAVALEMGATPDEVERAAHVGDGRVSEPPAA